MPRYKSTSEFRHTAVIQGKKFLIGPGDVIESPTQLSYIFLQEVAADTPLTVKTPFVGGRLQQQVNTLQQEKEQIVTTSSTGLEQLNQKLEAFMAKVDKDMDDIIKQVNERFEENEKNDLANKQADAEAKAVVNKRLNILKDAVRSMEDEIYGVQESPPPKNP